MNQAWGVMLQSIRFWVQHRVSYWVGRLADSRVAWIKNSLISVFMRVFPVNMEEARIAEPAHFDTFNAFFTRDLKDIVRPVAVGRQVIVSPVDGVCREYGRLQGGQQSMQVKGAGFTLSGLLAHQSDWVARFQGGHYMNAYLAPQDYHGVHMPIAGRCMEIIYVPGTLFPVRDRTIARVSDVFSRNERMIFFFDTEQGPLSIVMVGALIVGSVTHRWQGSSVQPMRCGKRPALDSWRPSDCTASATSLYVEKGDKIGCFRMGSTVIMLLGLPYVQWHDATLAVDKRLRWGQAVGQCAPNTDHDMGTE